MKLSFSTLGCPSWSFNDILSTAKDLGFDGIEIRGIGSVMYAPRIESFSKDNCEALKEKLAKRNIEIPIFSSGAALADPEKAAASFVEACDYINCAARMGVKYVRIMGTDRPEITDGDFDLCAKLYGLVCEYGKIMGVTPLIETNGKLSSSDEILRLLENTASDNVGVLWDLHHTVRYGNETPEETVRKLGDRIKHVHLKDSVMADGKVVYKMTGYGDIPLKEAVSELSKAGYEGYVSLEWVKRWQPDLQEPGIIFESFASYVKDLINNL